MQTVAMTLLIISTCEMRLTVLNENWNLNFEAYCISIGKYTILDNYFTSYLNGVNLCGVVLGFVFSSPFQGGNSLNSLSFTILLQLSFWEVI